MFKIVYFSDLFLLICAFCFQFLSEVFPACHYSPCVNGGVCQDSPNGKDYTCECLDGYSGVNCETAGMSLSLQTNVAKVTNLAREQSSYVTLVAEINFDIFFLVGVQVYQSNCMLRLCAMESRYIVSAVIV